MLTRQKASVWYEWAHSFKQDKEAPYYQNSL